MGVLTRVHITFRFNIIDNVSFLISQFVSGRRLQLVFNRPSLQHLRAAY